MSGNSNSGRRAAAENEATLAAMSENLAVAQDVDHQRLMADYLEAARRRDVSPLKLKLPVIESPTPEYVADMAKQQAADEARARAFKAMTAREAAIREAHRRAWAKLSRRALTEAISKAMDEHGYFRELTAPVVR